jgi:hypothetical protein
MKSVVVLNVMAPVFGLKILLSRVIYFHFTFKAIFGKGIEQTANTYKLCACNEALIKTSKPKLNNED